MKFGCRILSALLLARKRSEKITLFRSLFGGRGRATNIIDVAMLQSLDKEGGIDSRIKNYGQIIADECHHISAFSFERVMMEANAKYIIGLTATPYRRDGHQPIITMQCGPLRYKNNLPEKQH